MSQGKKRGWFHQTASKFKHLVGKSLHGSTSTAKTHTPEKSSTSREQLSHGSAGAPRESLSIPRNKQKAEPSPARTKAPERSKSPEQPDRFWNMPTSYLAGALAAPPPKATELPMADVPQYQQYQLAENLAAQEQQRPARQLETFWSVPTHYLASMMQAPPPKPTELPQIDQGPFQHYSHPQQLQQHPQQLQQQHSQQQQEQLPPLTDALLPFADVLPQFASDMPLLGESMPAQQSTWQVPRPSQRDRERELLQREQMQREREQMQIQPPPRVASRCSTREQMLLRERERERERYLLEREMLERGLEHMRERERGREIERARGLERVRTHDREFSPEPTREPSRQTFRDYTLGPIPPTFRDINDPTPYHERIYQERARDARESRDVYNRSGLPDRSASFNRSRESFRDPYTPLPTSHSHGSATPHSSVYGYSSPRQREITPARDIAREQSHARGYWELRAYTEDRADGRCNTCVDTRKTRPSNDRLAIERAPTIKAAPERTPEYRTQTPLQPSASSRRRITASPPTLLADEDDRYTSDDASQASFSDRAYDLDAGMRDLWLPARELRSDEPELEEEEDDASLRWLAPPPPTRTTRGYAEENDYLPPKMPPPPRPDERRRARTANGEKHHAPPVRTPFNLPALMPAFHMPPAYGF